MSSCCLSPGVKVALLNSKCTSRMVIVSSFGKPTGAATGSGAGVTIGQPVASTGVPFGVFGHLSLLLRTPSPSSSPSPWAQQYAPAITPTAPPKPAATEAVWKAPIAAPASAPQAAHRGQSVFFRPAHPVNTLVTKIRGNAVRIMLIQFFSFGIG